MGKYSVGRLRPHFLEVCNPDFSQFQCFEPDGQGNNLPIFVTEYQCRGNSELFPVILWCCALQVRYK